MKFEKISYEQALKDHCDDVWETIKLPQRATRYSAGYDIFTPYDLCLTPGCTYKFPTGIRAILDEDKCLMIVPRSGLGFKYGIMLSNTVGLIDADYSKSDNEGHIWVSLYYPERNHNPLQIKSGEAICQGIILPYYKTEDDISTSKRNGGFGSTSQNALWGEE